MFEKDVDRISNPWETLDMKTASKSKKATSVYVLCTIAYEGSAPEPKFTFDAKDDADAKDKGQNWCLRHHNKRLGRDVIVRVAEGADLNCQKENDWVK